MRLVAATVLVYDFTVRKQYFFCDHGTVSVGLFLCGPSVRHEDHVFCFIYKFRQRFAVVAKSIATSLGHAAEMLEAYKVMFMYLDDFEHCGDECVTC